MSNNVAPSRSVGDAVIDALDEDEVHRRMLTLVLEEAPSYRGLQGTEQWDGVVGHARRHMRFTLDCLRRRTAPTVEELQFVVEHARLRASQGVPLAQLLHAYRAGYVAIWRSLIEASRRLDADPSVTLELGDIAMAYFNAISSTLTEAYLLEQQRLRQDDARDRTEIVARFLAGDPETATAHSASLARYGLSTSTPVLVVSIGDSAGRISMEMLERLSEALGRGRPGLVARTHDRVVAILPATDDEEQIEKICRALVDTLGGPDLRAGVGLPWPRLGDVPAAFADAERAMALARAERPVIALGRVSLLEDLMARADRTTQRLVGSWVQRLLDEDDKLHGELLDTLITYLSEGFSVTRSAKALQVHPNTVRYRLGRVESVTGKGTRSFDDLVEIVIALRLTGHPCLPRTPRRSD